MGSFHMLHPREFWCKWWELCSSLGEVLWGPNKNLQQQLRMVNMLEIPEYDGLSHPSRVLIGPKDKLYATRPLFVNDRKLLNYVWITRLQQRKLVWLHVFKTIDNVYI